MPQHASAGDGFRYERKYLTTNLSRYDLENFVRLHPAVFHGLYYPRQVSSIYFDTPDFDYFQQNLMGQGQRKKVRVRWYDPMEEGSHHLLEVKVRDGDVIQKIAQPMEQFTRETSLDEISRVVRSILASYIAEAGSLQPTLVNSYKRSYFSNAALGMRLTVDSDLQFSSPSDWQRQHVTNRLDATILECKYAVADDPKLVEVMNSIPLRVTKSSKYVMGVQLCHPWATSYEGEE